ncbi:MAG: L-serine ammonia-lyase, iron-sulfur-dependent, subunit alpha [Prevotellaceae bacterium]|nr:L-serine ammonia-lyase, iron-sulfur-dependent, subunit alpha [Prevotellaceae bacterium]
MTIDQRSQLIELIRREVVPAIGCTEPMAVSLCTARTREALGQLLPDQIEVCLSANVLKNAMGVGIPGTSGMIGLPIAVAMGAIGGKSAYGLEVLKDCTPQVVAEATRLVAQGCIRIGLKEDTREKLYIEVTCRAGTHRARSIISGAHTRFVWIERDGEPLYTLAEEPGSGAAAVGDEPTLNLRIVYDFATTAPLEELRFIRQAAILNKQAAETSLRGGTYGHSLGKTLIGTAPRTSDDTLLRILSYTSAACDARMAGAMIPVMSNSGSGNQGIAATLPVVIYAEQHQATDEQLIRALILSHLTAIYIKQHLGRLSALCGCVIASTGSSCGITYLMGGGYQQVAAAVKNMIANLTGMICDGAKPSCSLKVASGVSTALLSALLAMNGKCVTSAEGIIEEDVDKSIRNLTRIGSEGMQEIDKMVLDMMIHKGES